MYSSCICPYNCMFLDEAETKTCPCKTTQSKASSS